MKNVLAPITPPGNRSSQTWLWVSRVLAGLVGAFLLVDAVGKLIALAPVVAATRQLGFAVGVIRPLGVVLAACTLLHVIPRTRLLGALLLTAYLGGATAALVRTGASFWFPVALGAIIWLTCYLRSPSLRALLHSPQVR